MHRSRLTTPVVALLVLGVVVAVWMALSIGGSQREALPARSPRGPLQVVWYDLIERPSGIDRPTTEPLVSPDEVALREVDPTEEAWVADVARRLRGEVAPAFWIGEPGAWIRPGDLSLLVRATPDVHDLVDRWLKDPRTVSPLKRR